MSRYPSLSPRSRLADLGWASVQTTVARRPMTQLIDTLGRLVAYLIES